VVKGEKGSRGEMRRMRAKPEVPVVVGMEEGKDLGRQLARRVPVSNRCLSTTAN
jgi:hypothetical protein